MHRAVFPSQSAAPPCPRARKTRGAAHVHLVHLHWNLGTALILPRIPGEAKLLHSRALRPATCGCSPLSPSRCWPGSRATGFRVHHSQDCRTSPESWEALSLPNLRWRLNPPSRLIARPFLGSKSQPFYRLSAERNCGRDAFPAGRRACAVRWRHKPPAFRQPPD